VFADWAASHRHNSPAPRVAIKSGAAQDFYYGIHVDKGPIAKGHTSKKVRWRAFTALLNRSAATGKGKRAKRQPHHRKSKRLTKAPKLRLGRFCSRQLVTDCTRQIRQLLPTFNRSQQAKFCITNYETLVSGPSNLKDRAAVTIKSASHRAKSSHFQRSDQTQIIQENLRPLKISR
jgi:hypothetical protein